ncbi:MAG: hypothetical protein JW982_07440 [Spirochaetes bacterium]|nr:hypothetical protein [Spirochaetota bacterium]
MINRGALILRYKQPAIDWINSVDPSNDFQITLEIANEDRTVYLIEDDDAEDSDRMLKKTFKHFFENELFGWFTEESLWPHNLTYELFRKWFTVECHSMVEDYGSSELVDEDL